ncbi:flap endonuclease-1 (FEN-1) [Perkinsela sp. CCAP 1560/4]|nr:flap endonuclease-1 (FEN-1) [Perkinsela sp. CCAP 1560/4]|eukprot:KNH04219.1 flap endonuclease-1 (FEN-1) [Perkinsela sp. CCAP 1560/4]
MGIDGLSRVLGENVPEGQKFVAMKSQFGRRIAIDASCTIYQFLIALKGFQGGQGTELTNADGEVTSHLVGLWSRTLRMLSEGLRPIYVFDGAPPELKSQELSRRRERAKEAAEQLDKAGEEMADVELEKIAKRTVRVTPEQTAECKKLLTLMGIPVVQAPGEAEAQCVEIVKSGQAYAVGTEDMDALAFGAPRMLRHLTYSSSASKNQRAFLDGIIEYDLEKILHGLKMTHEEFIDLCILLGCDYTSKLPGVGPVRALDGIRQHRTIESFAEYLRSKAKSEEAFDESLERFDYSSARKLFTNPDVTPGSSLEIHYCPPDVAGLKRFLIEEKLFSEERIMKGIDKLLSIREEKTQKRLENFFGGVKSIKSTRPAGSAAEPNAKKNKPFIPSGRLQKRDFKGGKKPVREV